MIKFNDLQKVNYQYPDDMYDAVKRVYLSGQYILGEEVRKFEKDLASFIGTKYAIGVGNGLDALRLILRAYIELGIMKPGDEVICPAHTFIATILAVVENGLIPILVEPNEHTYNLDITKIQERITDRTKAIIIVHLYGQACWSTDLFYLAKVNNLVVIEDNAQAFGAMHEEVKTGALGDAAAFSFYPTKPLGALGDGGAITTDNIELSDMVRTIANYGGLEKYKYHVKGINSRLDEIQAAFLNVKMKYAQKELLHRRVIALYYLNNIKNENIILPVRDYDSAWHLFVIRTKQRNDLQRYLTASGIETLIHYPIPIHKQKAFKEWNNISLPITEKICEEILSLPLSSILTLDEAREVVNAINQWKG